MDYLNSVEAVLAWFLIIGAIMGAWQGCLWLGRWLWFEDEETPAPRPWGLASTSADHESAVARRAAPRRSADPVSRRGVVLAAQSGGQRSGGVQSASPAPTRVKPKGDAA